MKHNKNIDYLRAISILMVVIYHIYVITEMSFSNIYLNNIISFGGNLGVSFFFFISGYSIYKSLSKKETVYKEYLKKRLKRIAPHYYISLVVGILFTSAAVYISKEHLLNIISHVFFFHNLFYSCHGAINGVLWTMGVIFQFYLIAPLLKKSIDKYPKLTYVLSLILSLLIKWVIYYIILPKNDLDFWHYFIYGRQLFTTLDVFVLGMLLSKFEDKNKLNNTWNILLSILSFGFIILMILIGSNTFSFWNTSIYSSSEKGLLYFYILDLFIMLFSFFWTKIRFKSNMLSSFLSFISKHEYAIYIWHLLILNNLINNSNFINNLINQSKWKSYFILIVLLIVIPYIFDIIIENIDFSKAYNEIKIIYLKIEKYIANVIVIITFVCALTYIPHIFYTIKVGDENIYACQGACIIAKSIKDKMNCENDSCKYIYLDTEDTGYLYSNHLRYYLYPFNPKYYNSYFYITNYGTDTEFLNFIKEQEVDYIIVRNNEKLKQYGYELDLINGKIFTINHEAKGISNLLKEVN